VTYPYVCRRASELVVREIEWEAAILRRFAARIREMLALDDFELWRPRLIRVMFFPVALLIAYWAAWFGDRGVVASDSTSAYIAFEQSFPLADAWLLGAMLLSIVQLTRRRPSALIWLIVTGGAGLYLCALDVLYDVQHGIYTKPHGGAIELTINVLTATLSVGLLSFAWRFRRELLDDAEAHGQARD
jgi:hypothetical protein